MNTPNINSQGPVNPLGRSKSAGTRQDVKRTETGTAENDVAKISGGTETEIRDSVTSAADTFSATADRSRIMAYVTEVEKQEPVVREDVVQMARQRVSEGYYNTQEFAGALAARLINTER